MTSYLSAKCEARRSPIGGLGIFALKTIACGEIIAIWGGKIYSAQDIEQLASLNPSLLIHPLTVAEGFYMGPIDPSHPLETTDFFNHSCEPNAGIKGQIILVARRLIQKNEEICFDYETSESQTSVGMGFDCHCGHQNCKKRIQGMDLKNSEFYKKNRHYMSWYLQEKIERPH
jgi:SET domain-containing protein